MSCRFFLKPVLVSYLFSTFLLLLMCWVGLVGDARTKDHSNFGLGFNSGTPFRDEELNGVGWGVCSI